MKKGFTLMELMVYIAILGIIVIVAGQAFVDSTKFRIRSENMLKSSEESGRVSALIKEDLAQMGAKYWMNVINSKDTFQLASDVYMSDTDSSSFSFGSEDKRVAGLLDTLTFRKINYSAAGRFLGVQEIKWLVDDSGVLLRSCKTLDGGTATDDCPLTTPLEVAMADSVSRFTLSPSMPGPIAGSSSSTAPRLTEDGAAEILFPETGTAFGFVARDDENEKIKKLSLSETDPKSLRGFVSNYSITAIADKNANQVFLAKATSASTDWDDSDNGCISFTFEPDETYMIRFKLNYNADYMRIFQPTKDHFAIGLRPKTGSGKGQKVDGISDFMIYPPQIEDKEVDKSDEKINLFRNLEFSVKEKVENVCVAITIALESPLANRGTLKFDDFQVLKRLNEVYYFPDAVDYTETDTPYNPEDSEKLQVKAFRLNVNVSKRKEQGQSVVIIPVPNNGIKIVASDETP